VAEHDICVEIGGLPILLKNADARFQRKMRERYSGFVSERPADCCLEVILCSKDRSGTSDADIRVERSAQLWRITRGDFEAEWDPHTRRGWVRQTANPYSIDTALRIIHSLELAAQGGFLLHSSSVIRNGRAFLFSGVSGAGKTTISRLAPGDATLLTDEISYVRPDGSAFRAFGTPFAGELAKPGENVSAPIAELFLLAKGPDNHVEDVHPANAARALLRNVLFFADDSRLTTALLNTACDFVSRVPVRRLTFYPDHRVWDLIQ